MQQWLFALFLWKLYALGGVGGLIAYAHIICVVLAFAEAFLIWTVSAKNRFVTAAISLPFSLFFASKWLATQRPWTISLLLFLSEIWLLERYRREQPKWMPVAFLVLSVLCVNVHAAMWPMIFVLALPYLAEAVADKYGILFFTREDGWGIRPLVMLSIAAFLGGFLNPYGWEAMQYGLISYGNPSIANYVKEMIPVAITMPGGAFSIPSIILLSIFYARHPVPLRFVLLSAGTAFMALLASRNLAFFLLFGFLGPAWHFRECKMSGFRIPNIAFYFIFLFSISSIVQSHAVLEKAWAKIPLGFLLCILVPVAHAVMFHHVKWFCYFCIFLLAWMPSALQTIYRPPISPYLQESVRLIQKENPKAKVLTGYEDGGYAEFQGLSCYLDPRGDIFIKETNWQKDYMKEWLELRTGALYYKDFFASYPEITYVLSHGQAPLYEYLAHDPEYELVYDSWDDKDPCRVFRRKGQVE